MRTQNQTNSKTFVLLAALIACAHLETTHAVTLTKQVNSIETSLNNASASAFFTNSPDNLILLTNITTTLTPGLVGGSIGAGDAASSISTGTLTIVGASTSAGGWTDTNGIPDGITLTFKIQFTVSTPDPGSFLTTQGNATTQLGNGIGITQVEATTGDLGVGETLQISAINISEVSWTGSLTESGFSFTPGTVSNPKWNRLRSNNLSEGTEGATVTVGTDTWGFGTSTGTVASNLPIDNNYTEVSPSFVATGPLVLTTDLGVWNLKGVGFQYQVTYDIAAVAQPLMNTPVISGSELILTGSGFPSGQTFSILSSPNVGAPLSNWVTNSTGTFTASGTFSNAVPYTASSQEYFTIKTP